MRLDEIVVFHGTSKKHRTALRSPIFVTTSESGANWFATNRGGGWGKGVILAGELKARNTLDLIKDGEDEFYEIADAAGIQYSLDDYFDCDEIAQHSQYEGTNPTDMVYIPRFVTELKRRGYDSIRMWDTLENDSIETYILFDPKQFKIHG